jgi:hypothetical protein
MHAIAGTPAGGRRSPAKSLARLHCETTKHVNSMVREKLISKTFFCAFGFRGAWDRCCASALFVVLTLFGFA